MLDFTWKVFCMTGSVDTYLLMKEMENEGTDEQKLERNGDTEPATSVEMSDGSYE